MSDSSRWFLADAAPARRGRAAAGPRTLAIPLPGLEERPAPPGPCPRCGSLGFNLHQRGWREVKDPHLRRVLVVRYLCKRCGHTRRRYPGGSGRGRQTDALVRLSVLLYALGLTYEQVAGLLRNLGCPLSSTIVRKNVLAHGHAGAQGPSDLRPKLRPVGPRRLGGPDGALELRIAGSAQRRWLVLEILPGPDTERFEQRLRMGLSRRGGADGDQPDSHRKVSNASVRSASRAIF